MATSSDAVFVDGELVEPQVKDPDCPGPNQQEFITSKSLKEEEEGEKREDKTKGAENLKSSLIISGVFIAVIGAIFAVAKKIKQAS